MNYTEEGMAKFVKSSEKLQLFLSNRENNRILNGIKVSEKGKPKSKIDLAYLDD